MVVHRFWRMLCRWLYTSLSLLVTTVFSISMIYQARGGRDYAAMFVSLTTVGSRDVPAERLSSVHALHHATGFAGQGKDRRLRVPNWEAEGQVGKKRTYCLVVDRLHCIIAVVLEVKTLLLTNQ